jgi:hypothetical protein
MKVVYSVDADALLLKALSENVSADVGTVRRAVQIRLLRELVRNELPVMNKSLILLGMMSHE